VVNIQTEVSASKAQTGAEPLPFGEEFSFGDELFKRFFGERFPGMPRQQTPQRERRTVGQGSGFVFASQDGLLADKTYVLTNNHVVEGAERIRVRLQDGREFDAEITGRDPQSDVAVIEIPTGGVPPLQLADSAELDIGEWVMAIGNPHNFKHTVSVGVVSALGRKLPYLPDSDGQGRDVSLDNFIQTDAAINFGNSGGPLVDLYGNVVGINTAINAAGQNIGFAIPVNVARRILPQLRERGRVVRGYLGVSINNLSREEAEAFGLDSTDGALVESVVEGHAADAAGVRHGDVIVAVDGEPIEDTRELIDTISSLPPGTEVDLGIVRNGKRMTIEVTLEERESEAGVSEPSDRDDDEGDVFERVGVTVNRIDSGTRQMYRLEDDVAGVVVTRVRPLSPASEAGMQPGFVITEANGEAIEGPEDLRSAVSEIEAGGYLRLYVYIARADVYRFVILKLEE
jgi:serine protease Do